MYVIKKSCQLYAYVLLISLTAISMSCKNNNEKNAGDSPVASTGDTSHPGSFAGDLRFLQQKDSGLLVLSLPENKEAQVIVSPKYQAKVFTSTAAGLSGRSFGWVNYKAFSGTVDPHMNAYGGENRIWLGPEGGKFSLFFRPGAKMDFAHWKTPSDFDTAPWKVVTAAAGTATLSRSMELENYAGTHLKLSVDRTVRILSAVEMTKETGMDFTDKLSEVKAVAYTTENKLTNTGDKAWDEKTGMPCIWILDMFTPSPETVIVVPFKQTPVADFDQVATADYFGQIGPDRLKHDDHVLYLKADGKSRGKLGVRPAKAKQWIGSYGADTKVLTLLHFDLDSTARYLNQQWNTDKPPFIGEAVNAYNDGPLEDGSQMGPFYEMESVSPAAFLTPGASLLHRQSVYHFTGSPSALNAIAEKLLGVSLKDIENAFK